jgi:hypothetical protein
VHGKGESVGINRFVANIRRSIHVGGAISAKIRKDPQSSALESADEYSQRHPVRVAVVEHKGNVRRTAAAFSLSAVFCEV